jgi:hypothetical protein
VAEGARLESVYTGNRIVGSNPTPSANSQDASVREKMIELLVSLVLAKKAQFRTWSELRTRKEIIIF